MRESSEAPEDKSNWLRSDELLRAKDIFASRRRFDCDIR